MTTSFHLRFHAVRPAVTVARALSKQFELDFTEQPSDPPGRLWQCEDHVLADRLTIGAFTPEAPHDCPDQRHKSYLTASFSRGRARDRAARRDYLLRLLAHSDDMTLVSQTFTDD